MDEEQRSAVYRQALEAAESGDPDKLQSAIYIFTSLGGYSDAVRQAELCREKLNNLPAGKTKKISAAKKKILPFAAAVLVLAIGLGIGLGLGHSAKPKENIVESDDVPGVQITEAPLEERTAADEESEAGEAPGEETAAKQEKESIPLSDAKEGDFIRFGHYEQDNDLSNGAEAIEWLVLAKDEDNLLVISRYVLELQEYNRTYETITWENCTLRSWLNHEFFETAFSVNEQEQICLSIVTADPNPEYKISSGNDTQDHVFLLSANEANRYFPLTYSDEAKEMPYDCDAVTEGIPTVYAGTKEGEQRNEYRSWWLRTPGYEKYCYETVVHYFGKSSNFGMDVDYAYGYVRPAMRITIN